MLKITLLVLLAITLRLVSGGGLDLPSYISQCTLSDANFKDCLIKKANQAIPIIAKGDVAFNIPPLSPIVFAETPVNGIGLKYMLYYASTDDWKQFRFTEGGFDLKSGRARGTAIVDRLEIAARNYKIIEGKIMDKTVHGQGKYNMTIVGLKIHYSGKVRLYRKGEDEYFEYYDSKADTSCERAYFHFENLQSSEKGLEDVNAYINKEWAKIFAQMKPAIDIYVNAFYMFAITPITAAVPFNKMYLP